jgi:hypothetical protein
MQDRALPSRFYPKGLSHPYVTEVDFETALAHCKVRGYIRRKDAPSIKYWKNTQTPIRDQVPDQDKAARDWQVCDPHDEERIVLTA